MKEFLLYVMVFEFSLLAFAIVFWIIEKRNRTDNDEPQNIVITKQTKTRNANQTDKKRDRQSEKQKSKSKDSPLFFRIISFIAILGIGGVILAYAQIVFDENNKLKDATINYRRQDYKRAFEIYSSISDNPIALNNIGYLFSIGLQENKDFEMADFFYSKAINKGYQKSIINRLCLKFNNYSDFEFLSMIDEYKTVPIVIEFFGKLLNDINSRKTVSEFFNMTIAERVDYWENLTSHRWSEERIKKYYHPQANIKTIRFKRQYLGAGDDYSAKLNIEEFGRFEEFVSAARREPIKILATYYKYSESELDIIELNWITEEFIESD